jgi:hypothetical protein
MDFYDSSGLAVAYCEDYAHLLLYSGEPVAYFEGDCVYSFSGRHLGWRHEGWIIDHNGDPFLFSEQAVGDLIKPTTQKPPTRGPRERLPEKQIRQFEPLRPPTSSKWSKLSPKEFFELN